MRKDFDDLIREARNRAETLTALAVRIPKETWEEINIALTLSLTVSLLKDLAMELERLTQREEWR